MNKIIFYETHLFFKTAKIEQINSCGQTQQLNDTIILKIFF
jgi:hypothetical protein